MPGTDEAQPGVGKTPPPIPVGALLTRLGVASLFPEILRGEGVDPKTVFDSAGLDIDRYSAPETKIHFDDLMRLATVSIEATGRPDLGLLIVERQGPETLGLLGRLSASAATLRAALEDLIHFIVLNQRDLALALCATEEWATLRVAPVSFFGPAAVALEDASVGICFHVIRLLMGPGWRPTAVYLCHAGMDREAGYRRVFRAPVYFNAERAGLVFPAADLDRPLRTGDADRLELRAAAKAAAAELAMGFEEKVRALIKINLSDPALSLAQIAGLAGMSGRTLNRRLAERGTTYTGLLQSVRYDAARHLLSNSDTPLSSVAVMLGYAELSVFSTAFRRWAGVSPRRWRQQHRAIHGAPRGEPDPETKGDAAAR